MSEDELNTHRAVEHLRLLVAAARGIVPPARARASPHASLTGLAELYRRAEGPVGDTKPVPRPAGRSR